MRLNVKVRGRGRPIVFFHGWGFNYKIWIRLSQALENEYCCYLVDLPGFGQSSLMPWLIFKQKLLAQLPKHFIVIGWSMGGLLATRLAVELPENVLHLINIASSPCFVKEENWPGIEKIVLSNFFKKLHLNPQRMLREFIHLQLKNLNYAFPESFSNTEGLKLGLEILRQWDLREALVHFPQPVTYLWGSLDAIVPQELVFAMKKLYPHFNYFLYSQAAHIPFLSHENKFIKNLKEVI